MSLHKHTAAIFVLAANFVSAIACISLNKGAFQYFPFPAALTSIHYAVTWAAVEGLHRAGKFDKRRVPPKHESAFYALIICWSLCNVLSNISLDRNSVRYRNPASLGVHSTDRLLHLRRHVQVGFYQLAKLMVTPSLVAFDYFFYARRITVLQALALLLACIGMYLVSVNDVQLHLLGATVASAAVVTAAAQKVLNSHMQQFGGLTTLQVMHNALPLMTLLSLFFVPLLDRRLHLLVSLRWASPRALGYILASAVAALCATWSATAIFGLLSALAHVLLGQVKTCSVLVVGAFLFDRPQNAQGMAGATLALVAITAYSIMRLPPAGGKGASAAPLVAGADAKVSDSSSEFEPDESEDERLMLRSHVHGSSDSRA